MTHEVISFRGRRCSHRRNRQLIQFIHYQFSDDQITHLYTLFYTVYKTCLAIVLYHHFLSRLHITVQQYWKQPKNVRWILPLPSTTDLSNARNSTFLLVFLSFLRSVSTCAVATRCLHFELRNPQPPFTRNYCNPEPKLRETINR